MPKWTRENTRWSQMTAQDRRILLREIREWAAGMEDAFERRSMHGFRMCGSTVALCEWLEGGDLQEVPSAECRVPSEQAGADLSWMERVVPQGEMPVPYKD